MFKRLAQWVLYRGPSRRLARRLLSSHVLQPVWESLYKLSLYGLNYGGGNVVEESGELWTLKWLQRRHAAARPGSPAVVFDVGAHDGSYSISAAEVFGDSALIYSIEPSAAVFKTLRNTTAGRSNIRSLNCGFGDHEGTAILYYEAVGSQKASVHADAHLTAGESAAGRLTEEIRLRSIDAFCAEEGLSRVDVLKIDVEGNELNVLRGATQMIENDAIGAIQFEFGEAQIGSRTFFKDIYEFLSPHYRIHRILGTGLSGPLEPYDARLEVYRTTNYLAVLREDPAR